MRERQKTLHRSSRSVYRAYASVLYLEWTTKPHPTGQSLLESFRSCQDGFPRNCLGVCGRFSGQTIDCMLILITWIQMMWLRVLVCFALGANLKVPNCSVAESICAHSSIKPSLSHSCSQGLKQWRAREGTEYGQLVGINSLWRLLKMGFLS